MSHKCYFPFPITPYAKISTEWPEIGRHIISTWTPNHIIIYTSCSPKSASTAMASQNFRKNFLYKKFGDKDGWWKFYMNFVSIMNASQWGLEKNSEHILALTITRWGFEQILRDTVESQKIESTKIIQNFKIPETKFKWVQEKDAWGIERNIHRETMQFSINVTGKYLQNFLSKILVRVDDVTPFVRKQRNFALGWTGQYRDLMIPRESPYILVYDYLAKDIDLDSAEELDETGQNQLDY